MHYYTKHKKTNYPQWFIDELVNPETKELAMQGNLSTTQKVEFRCTCGKTYFQKITNHINLSTGERKSGSCAECIKKNKKENRQRTYPQWFIDELVNEDDRIKAKSGKLSSGDKVFFVCPECGGFYPQRIASHICLSTGKKKQGCPKCGIKKQVESSRKTKGVLYSYPDWFVDSLYSEKDKKRANTESFYGKEELQFYCPIHNLVYTKHVRDVIDLKTQERKSGCPRCGKEQVINTLYKREYPEWFTNDLYLESDKIKARDGLLRLRDKVQFFCKEHSSVYSQLVSSHIDTKTNSPKYGCPQCKKERYLKTKSETRFYPDWFIEDLVNNEDRQRAIDGSLSSSELVEFKCKNNHIYKQLVKDHIILSRQEPNKGCPNCSYNRSSTELEIEEYIQSLGFTTEHKRFHSSILPLFEADIFIPEKNVAIEYNGSFFHKTLPEDGNSKSRMYHNQKFYSFRELGIKLVSIFDVDWETKREKIKQYLKDLLLPIQTLT